MYSRSWETRIHSQQNKKEVTFNVPLKQDSKDLNPRSLTNTPQTLNYINAPKNVNSANAPKIPEMTLNTMMMRFDTILQTCQDLS